MALIKFDLRRTRWRRIAACLFAVGVLASAAIAQDPNTPPPTPPPAPQSSAPTTAGNDNELRKAAQNPLATLVNVPVQDSSSLDTGNYGRVQTTVKIQPIIPVRLSENWNLIMRIIQPLTYQPNDKEPTGSTSGLGDMNPSFFLSPQHPRNVTWGVGPVLLIPTATDSTLGAGKFCIGPTALLVKQPGRWTLGVLVNNYWSVAGASDRKAVNQMLLQYFVNFNFRHGWYLTSSPMMTANWVEPSDKVWTVPVGGGVGKLVHFGPQAAKLSTQLFRNAIYPVAGSTWGLRAQVAFLFPKRMIQP